MVRIDDETTESLDDWVETGAVKSRSEGAALFIREGLKVRDEELARLKDALADVKAAKEKLREQAKDVLGG
jgi:Arc/MetJ-type ribon-helix-helix transcriptional regulator